MHSYSLSKSRDTSPLSVTFSVPRVFLDAFAKERKKSNSFGVGLLRSVVTLRGAGREKERDSVPQRPAR